MERWDIQALAEAEAAQEAGLRGTVRVLLAERWWLGGGGSAGPLPPRGIRHGISHWCYIR